MPRKDSIDGGPEVGTKLDGAGPAIRTVRVDVQVGDPGSAYCGQHFEVRLNQRQARAVASVRVAMDASPLKVQRPGTVGWAQNGADVIRVLIDALANALDQPEESEPSGPSGQSGPKATGKTPR